jgi:hypothetical protein
VDELHPAPKDALHGRSQDMRRRMPEALLSAAPSVPGVNHGPPNVERVRDDAPIPLCSQTHTESDAHQRHQLLESSSMLLSMGMGMAEERRRWGDSSPTEGHRARRPPHPLHRADDTLQTHTS